MPEAGAPGTAPRPPQAGDLPGVSGGVVRPLVLHPDPRLRAVSRPAAELGFAALCGLVADLFATLYAAGGRGLAAPQIGVSRRVFVMDEGWKTGTPAPLAMIDPQVVRRSRRTARAVEACLSIPDHPVEMRRPAEVRMAFFDLDGQACQRDMAGIAARIAQHELDHLNGVLIVDAEPRPPVPVAPALARSAVLVGDGGAGPKGPDGPDGRSGRSGGGGRR